MMVHLSNSEKLHRYDALQAAISFTLDNYRGFASDAENRYISTTGQISAYEKGRADTFRFVIEALERWKDDG